jgi:hypothetical protein
MSAATISKSSASKTKASAIKSKTSATKTKQFFGRHSRLINDLSAKILRIRAPLDLHAYSTTHQSQTGVTRPRPRQPRGLSRHGADDRQDTVLF